MRTIEEIPKENAICENRITPKIKYKVAFCILIFGQKGNSKNKNEKLQNLNKSFHEISYLIRLITKLIKTTTNNKYNYCKTS